MGAAMCGAGKSPGNGNMSIAPVTVHIYDVGTSGQVQTLNRWLRVLGTGAFHCGVEVHGKEYSFSTSGVFWCLPKCCRHHTYAESMQMGRTLMSPERLRELIKKLEAEWTADQYDLLKRNCCHFCAKLCTLLGVKPMPPWVTNLASTGAAIVDTEEHFTKVAEQVGEVVCCEPGCGTYCGPRENLCGAGPLSYDPFVWCRQAEPTASVPGAKRRAVVVEGHALFVETDQEHYRRERPVSRLRRSTGEG